MQKDTIAAISTPIGKSGIGIVRLSGREALSVAEKIFLSSNGKGLKQLPSHTIHYGWVKDKKDEIIDEVLLTIMRAPRTYTREDIVEINCHSGIVVLKRILDLILNCGVRLATPGEFTRRAYLNGRIDLAQAEAVLDVINSQTKDALSVALGQLKGMLSRRIDILRGMLVDILAQLEASIDFSDQDIELFSKEELSGTMQKIAQSVNELLATADKGTILREGVNCVICGKPNVGKSSLLNALLKRERAIVTAMPGTTRDTLDETIDLSGIPLRLIDTAGIIKAGNPAEKEAVKRSRACLKEATLALLVLDAGRKITAQDLTIARYILRKPVIVVLNKQDLPAKTDIKKAGKFFPGRKIVAVSALKRTGLDNLEREIADYIWQGKAASAQDVLVTNIRHRQALKRAEAFLKRAIKTGRQGHSAEIVIPDIKKAQASLEEIIGNISCEDVLERIFSQFCIGK